ncbi:polysaccharide export outer membrane protein [Dyella sp. OK004]|nr:polysaccharide export outer membrane protein [Dyella sp. OK004]
MPPVRPITAELIDMQARAMAASPLGAQVLSLVGEADPVYRVGPRDTLAITVWNHPELSVPLMPGVDKSTPAAAQPMGYEVDATGRLHYPLIGAVAVGGKDTAAIRGLLTLALAKYIHDPQVDVRVAGFRSRRIFVDGEVRLPGDKPITDVPMTLALALGEAGGVTSNSDLSDVVLTRNGKDIALDLPRLAAAGVSADRIPLQNNDLVRVLSRENKQVFVAGEVGRPSPVPMLNGQLSLGDALAASGSVSQTGSNPHGIYVIRPHEGQPTEVFQLDAKSPVTLALAGQFPLRPRDLVYVQTSGLMQWSRMTSLLVPSSQALYNAQRATGP